jgi:hypothetical protein
MGMSGQLHTPAALLPGTHWIGAVLEAVVKWKIPSPHRESNPRTLFVQALSNTSFDNVADWVSDGDVIQRVPNLQSPCVPRDTRSETEPVAPLVACLCSPYIAPGNTEALKVRHVNTTAIDTYLHLT